MPTRRPRVLHLAFTCGPNQGSEPGVGWHRAVQAARFCDTWVITRELGCRQWIEEHQARHGDIDHLRFVYVPLTSIEHRVIGFGGLKHIAQRAWQRRAFALAKRLHNKLRFDLTHKTTFCGYREPSCLGQLDAPFVWGPIGGTQNYPWRALAGAGPAIALSEAMRSVFNIAQLCISRRVPRAARQASALLAANKEVARNLAQVTGVHSEVVSDVGVERANGKPRPPRRAAAPLRILWAGVLELRKSLDLLIDALAHLPPDVKCQVRVMGDGPMRRNWQRRAQRIGVDHCIQWFGRLPHDEALQQFAWADVMAFTSLRDTTGTVIVEALAAGAPVIGIDHQGCADVVNAGCGLKVPPGARDAMSRGIAEQLVRLARDWQLLSRLSRGALNEAKQYLWSEHGIRMARIYNRVLEDSGSDCRCDIDDTTEITSSPITFANTKSGPSNNVIHLL